MRKALITLPTLTAIILLTASALYAQEGRARPALSDRESELLRRELLSRNKQFIVMNLPLTDAEAQKFWPVYDHYAAELALIYDLRDAILTQYSDNFGSLTDTLALSMARRWAEADAATVRLRLRYFPLFEEVLPGKKTALFFQLDGLLAARIGANLAAEIPLIQP